MKILFPAVCMLFMMACTDSQHQETVSTQSVNEQTESMPASRIVADSVAITAPEQKIMADSVAATAPATKASTAAPSRPSETATMKK